jgi:hypothetical protein
LLIEKLSCGTPVINHESTIINSSIINSNQKRKEVPMCPACMASAAVMAGSVMSTGGIAALAVRIVRGKKSGTEDNSKTVTEGRNDDGNDDDKQN